MGTDLVKIAGSDRFWSIHCKLFEIDLLLAAVSHIIVWRIIAVKVPVLYRKGTNTIAANKGLKFILSTLYNLFFKYFWVSNRDARYIGADIGIGQY